MAGETQTGAETLAPSEAAGAGCLLLPNQVPFLKVYWKVACLEKRRSKEGLYGTRRGSAGWLVLFPERRN